jgi:hypothetical protein
MRNLRFHGLARRALVLALVLSCAAGCSTSSNLSIMLFADPGKYEYHTCDQIQAASRGMAAREKALRELIEKAERGAAGGVVSTVAYRGEHRTVVEEIEVIEATARRKNCLTPSTWRSNTAIQ